MLINLKYLTPTQAKWVAEHERLHKEAFDLFIKRKQFKLEMEKYITNERIREENNGDK